MIWEDIEIEELAQMISMYGLSEVELVRGDDRIVLKKQLTIPSDDKMVQKQIRPNNVKTDTSKKTPEDFRHITEKKALLDKMELVKESSVEKGTSNKETMSHSVWAEDKTYVRSPLAGIFYRQAKPGNPPYVEVGQRVKKGDVLCIVEAMKMINEIVADREGIVKQFFVENEQFVEYGTPLIDLDKE